MKNVTLSLLVAIACVSAPAFSQGVDKAAKQAAKVERKAAKDTAKADKAAAKAAAKADRAAAKGAAPEAPVQ